MPAEGRTPLTADEIAALRAWILAGASPISDQYSRNCHGYGKYGLTASTGG